MAKTVNPKIQINSLNKCDNLSISYIERQIERNQRKKEIKISKVYDYLFHQGENPLAEITQESIDDYNNLQEVCQKMTEKVLESGIL